MFSSGIIQQVCAVRPESHFMVLEGYIFLTIPCTQMKVNSRRLSVNFHMRTFNSKTNVK
jgi:hypothetical protein